jgi:hypothetical protein
MKKILLLLCICTFFVSAYGQGIDSTNIKISNAINLLNGYKGRIDKPKANIELKRYANMGIPRAMNALGLSYINGQGIPVDTIMGLQWLKVAGETGYPQAWHNLGIIYKYGRSGVKQNLAEAFQFMDKAASQQDLIGLYDAGYMLYKGLGCTQDYTKAYTYFKQASDKEYSPAMYMLGLCYRNGYGVDRNMGDANFWLAKASAKGYKPASNELNSDEPENKLSRLKVKGNNITSQPTTFKRIPHIKLIKDKQIDGTYEGILVTYDWSGAHIIKESPFSLILHSNGSTVNAEWREQGSDTIIVQGLWTDTCLLFTKAEQGRNDHYNISRKVKWNFTNARLQLLNDFTGSYLAGNIQMFSPETMEPQRPMYMNIRKTQSVDSKAITNSDINKFAVYPNPFSEGLNVDFYQSSDSKVNARVYTTNGNCIYSADLGNYAVGEQKLTLLLKLPTGVYFFKLITDSKQYQTIVIRK